MSRLQVSVAAVAFAAVGVLAGAGPSAGAVPADGPAPISGSAFGERTARGERITLTSLTVPDPLAGQTPGEMLRWVVGIEARGTDDQVWSARLDRTVGSRLPLSVRTRGCDERWEITAEALYCPGAPLRLPDAPVVLAGGESAALVEGQPASGTVWLALESNIPDVLATGQGDDGPLRVTVRSAGSEVSVTPAGRAGSGSVPWERGLGTDAGPLVTFALAGLAALAAGGLLLRARNHRGRPGAGRALDAG
ncbi:hypothetical protein [Zhihengliuella sp.]|uniref:hypothetical protein n=1 Tax=Zhihengliuella sp. TaxID=1954483 RepID=UPI0028114FFE|nr:hypothetical protein [Zhihengliuella sp.]